MVQTSRVDEEKTPALRSVTAEEIEHFKQHGWVKLEQFLPPAVIEPMLAYAIGEMGDDGTKGADPDSFSYFNSLPVYGLDKPSFEPVLKHFGHSSVALRNLRVSPGARYFLDFLGVKLPSNGKGGHNKTEWHQDFAAQVSDRSGGMVFWVALADLTPEHGTMQFLSGSHRQGVMGDYRTYGDGDLLDVYPELADECPSSGPLHLKAGDVTVHSDLCVHMAGANTTSQPRWSYLAIMNPADARWTGAPSVSFATDGLELLQTLDEKQFPTIA